jgi:hypothetical protein
MEQVRKKLIEDGVKDELITLVEKDKYVIKKHFEGHTMENYQNIISAVTEYFELFRKSASKLEFIVYELH